MGVSEPLNVVEDEPRQRYDHEHDEGDGDKEYAGLVDTGVVGRHPSAQRDVHHDPGSVVHELGDVLAISLTNKDRHNVVY